MKRLCVISGAASGIGRATLELFLTRGYACLGFDNDRSAIDRLLDDVPVPSRDRVTLVEADLLADDQIVVTALDAIGNDRTEMTLVNSLGGSAAPNALSTRPASHSWENFVDVLTFNLKPLHAMTQACIPVMKRNGYGRIVNVSSISARKPLRTVEPEYAAAKAAILGLSRHLASELAEHGILVNVVCPGVIATDRIKQRWRSRDTEINSSVLADIPLERLGEPEEVAATIYFLGSSSTYTTGCVLDVNGGMYMP